MKETKSYQVKEAVEEIFGLKPHKEKVHKEDQATLTSLDVKLDQILTYLKESKTQTSDFPIHH